jgi:hypothetical protein
MTAEYEIDISHIEMFANDMMKINVIWKVEYYVNGGWCIRMPVNDKTTNWMINTYGADGTSLENHDFFIVKN